MRALITVCALMMCVLTPSVYASDYFTTENPRFYVGVDIIATSSQFSNYVTEYKDSAGVVQPYTIDQTFEVDGEVNGAALKLGFHFTNFVAAEIHFSKPQEIALVDGTTFNADLTGSAFLRLELPFRSVIPYILAGGSYMNWRYETPDLVAGTGTIKIEETVSGPAAGAGIEIYGGEHTAFNISWIRYMQATSDGDGTFKHDAITFGLVHWFEFPNLYRRF